MYVPDDTHKALVLIEHPEALAYEWIIQYAKNLSANIDKDEYGFYEEEITAEELIETAQTHLGDAAWGDYITRGGALEGIYTDSVFWDKLAILLGKEIPTSQHANFFSCAC